MLHYITLCYITLRYVTLHYVMLFWLVSVRKTFLTKHIRKIRTGFLLFSQKYELCCVKNNNLIFTLNKCTNKSLSDTYNILWWWNCVSINTSNFKLIECLLFQYRNSTMRVTLSLLIVCSLSGKKHRFNHRALIYLELALNH